MKIASWKFLVLSIFLFGIAVWAKETAADLQEDNDANAASETWGGDDVRLQLTAEGATVEFDCAEGRVLQTIKTEASGKFSARGTYTPAQFGPVRKNNPPQEVPAIYKGTISGATMHLQVVPENQKIQPTSFTLIKGDRGRIHRCH